MCPWKVAGFKHDLEAVFAEFLAFTVILRLPYHRCRLDDPKRRPLAEELLFRKIARSLRVIPTALQSSQKHQPEWQAFVDQLSGGQLADKFRPFLVASLRFVTNRRFLASRPPIHLFRPLQRDFRAVAGEGIEPPTRGFSVLCSAN